MISQQQEILARNGMRQQWKAEYDRILMALNQTEDEIDSLTRRLADLNARKADLVQKAQEAQHTPAELEMESTAELERNISEIDAINAKVRDNLAKEQAQIEADDYQRKYEALSAEIDEVRKNRMKLLDGAAMPLEGLSIDHGSLIYKGQPWDNMSGSDQLKVSAAIVRKLNPKCGFVLLDKLEQMDLDTLREFGTWLEKEGLQAIATRVSTGDECSIYIEDGYSIDHEGNKTAETLVRPAEMMKNPEPAVAAPKWEAGKF
jgi:hypothetical protein